MAIRRNPKEGNDGSHDGRGVSGVDLVDRHVLLDFVGVLAPKSAKWRGVCKYHYNMCI